MTRADALKYLPRWSKLPGGMPPLHPAVIVATGFGSGRLSPAPGTWGTLAALAVAALVGPALGPLGLLAGAALWLALGLWAATSIETMSGRHDEGWIVIDEWAGLWLALAFIPAGTPALPLWYGLAFLLFRAFDILKPGPIGWLDRSVGGAIGVMADDLAAGAAAGLTLLLGSLLWMS